MIHFANLDEDGSNVFPYELTATSPYFIYSALTDWLCLMESVLNLQRIKVTAMPVFSKRSAKPLWPYPLL